MLERTLPPFSALPFLALLTACALLTPVQAQTETQPRIRVLATAPLFNLGQARVGEARLEQEGTRRYLHVTGAGNVAGTALELLLSDSKTALELGDHRGPGPRAVWAGLIEQAEVRLELPLALNLATLNTVWVWCPAVKLPAARGRWTLTPAVK